MPYYVNMIINSEEKETLAQRDTREQAEALAQEYRLADVKYKDVYVAQRCTNFWRDNI